MLTPSVILACAVLAAFVAWQFGGREGAGVVAGYLAGGAAAGLGAARQKQLLRTRPTDAMRGVAEGLLLKLAFVLAGALVFRYVDAAAARVDWRFYLVSFALTAIVIAIVATLGIQGGVWGWGPRGGGSRGTDPNEELDTQ